MPAGCRVVKTPDNISDIADNLQESKAIEKVLSRFPKMGAIIRAINPAADIGDHLKRTVAALFAAREERDVAVQVALAQHMTNHKPLSQLLDGYDLTSGMADFTAKSTGRTIRLHWNDALQGNLGRWKLTPEQGAAMKNLKDIWDDVRFDYNRFGGTLDEEGDLFPRIIKGWVDDTGKFQSGDTQHRAGGGKVRIGGTMTKTRAVRQVGIDPTTNQPIYEVIPATEMVQQKNWRYTEAEDGLAQRAREVALRSADLQLQDWLKSQPFIIKGRKPTSRMPGHAPAADFGMGTADEFIEIKPFLSEKVPALAGYEAPAEITKYIEDILARPEKVDIPVISQLMDESRAMVASFDVGTIGIQMMGALAADLGHLLPRVADGKVIWAPSAIFPKSVIKSLPAIANPAWRRQYIAANADIVNRWGAYLGNLNSSEFLEALRDKPSFLPYRALHWAEQPTSRFFAASLDVAKIEYIKSLEKMYGTDISLVDKERLGGWVRNVLGQTSTNRLGMSPSQQNIESTFLFFSPRFTRSIGATVGSLRHMDKAGAEAWSALGGMAAAGTIAYVGFAAALGQQPQFDPRKPGFMSLRIGDNYVGIGGAMKAVSSLAVKTATDPKSITDLDLQTNPFLKFWRNRTSPLTTTAIEVLTGKDAMGAKIDDGSDWLKIAGNKMFPFAAQSAIEANGGAGSKLLASFANGVGMSANPMRAWDIYDKYLKDQRMADGSQRFPDGVNTVNSDENQFTTFQQHDSTAQHLKQNWEDQRVGRGGDSAASVRIQRERADRIDLADAEVAKTGDYYTYRQNINAIRALSREEFRALSIDAVKNEGDKAKVNTWYDIYSDKTIQNPITGGIDSSALESAQAAWKQANPGEYERIIEPNEKLGLTPQETQLRVERKRIEQSGWWETDTQAWGAITARNPQWTAGAKDIAAYKTMRMQALTEAAAKAGNPTPELWAERRLGKDPLIRVFDKLRAKYRLVLQRQNPDIISLLSKWGYNQTSLQEYRIASQYEAQQRQQGNPTSYQTASDLSS
jgi:hypothetical protein